MSEFILVWYLVSISGGTVETITYSPPLKSQEDCQRIVKTLPESYYRYQCIQVSTLKSK